MNRLITLGLAALLLTGCDGPDKPPAKPNEPPTIKPATQSAAPPLAPAAAPKIGAAKVAPAGQPLPVGKPLVEPGPERAGAAQERGAADKKPVRTTAARTPAVATRLPEAKLDLSLPQEPVDQLQSQPLGQVAKPRNKVAESSLLPPLFGGRKDTDSFELGAQLITDQNVGQAKENPVQGAELQFKFHR